MENAADNYKYVEGSIELKDVMIGTGTWRNFSGKKTEVNKSGERRFTIFLPEGLYSDLYEEGWFVKHNEKYAGRNSEYTMDISVRFDVFPPSKLELVASDGVKVNLTEETIGSLDTVDIARCDVVINPHNWEVNGRKGVKAYLDQITVVAKKPRRSLNASMRSDDEDEEF